MQALGTYWLQWDQWDYKERAEYRYRNGIKPVLEILMKEINFSTSACRYCRFYEPEGRRGGSCQMLGVPVESSWEACAFASPPFDTTLKKLEDIFQLDTPVNRESNRNASPSISKIEVEDNLQITLTNNNFASTSVDDVC